MKLVLLTNMPSEHQAPLAANLANQLGVDNFRLVFAEPTSASREEMGWQDTFEQPYILRLWQGEDTQNEIRHWIETADVVVQGRFPMSYVKRRIKAGKLTFAYQERFWKRGFHWPRFIARLPRIYRRYWSLNYPNHHLLAAGAYVTSDLHSLGCFKQRAWKFGYFLQPDELPSTRDNERLRLLWCARFAPVKRAFDALQIADALKQKRVDFELHFIGDGEQREEIEAKANKMALPTVFHGWQNSEQVKRHMQQADVLLMTSGFGEGWGMVINEAQNAACMIVANRVLGSAPWLVDDGETGLLYDSDKLDDLAERLTHLEREEICKMGEAGFVSHKTQWSAPVAAKRLVTLSQLLLDGQVEQAEALFTQGLCSKA